MTLELIEASKLLGIPPMNDWPQSFNLFEVARLQAWQKGMDPATYREETRNWCQWLELEIRAQAIECTATQKRICVTPARDIPAKRHGLFASFSDDRFIGRAHTVPAKFKDVPEYQITAQAFGKWIQGQGKKPSPHVAAWLIAHGVTDHFRRQAQAAPVQQPAPVAQAERTLKRSVMVKQHLHEWPTIVDDLREASRNKLTEQASVGKGFWYVDRALAWAETRGKLKQPAKVHELQEALTSKPTMASLPGRTHKMQG